MFHKVVHLVNGKKRSDSFKRRNFRVKIAFQEFSNFSEAFGLILLAPLPFLKLLIWTSCSFYQEMISKGP